MMTNKSLCTAATIIALACPHVLALPNPSSVLCASMGYQVDKGDCVFPDSTRCNQWAFWRGECGQKHHICTKKHGVIVTVKKTPMCQINHKLYNWTLQKPENSSDSKWTVVLTPVETPFTTDS